eukprot:CAMPEP_0178396816 /NCGR_PEP_ID=MMETSP0689_2-20121128/13921_1 /TAXON_ID=160604 /ORGANISM="Amphidinium massartii, Strain CS-259" /LENGTH=132 /DNA_ID=CAMNT_0020017497 /DNA_START=175 /DNA_END=573 /DNA_ORIENTATION=+
MSVVKAGLLAWSEGKLSDPTTAAKYFAEDGVVDPSGPNLPAFHAYHGVEGLITWNNYFDSLVEIKDLKQSLSPGPAPDSVYWTYGISAVVKSSGKDIKLTGVDLFKVTGGKISYIKIYWDDVNAATELLSGE